MYEPCSDELCKDSHVFNWTGSNAFDEVPEGTPCECGLTTAHYEECPSAVLYTGGWGQPWSITDDSSPTGWDSFLFPRRKVRE